MPCIVLQQGLQMLLSDLSKTFARNAALIGNNVNRIIMSIAQSSTSTLLQFDYDSAAHPIFPAQIAGTPFNDAIGWD